MSTKSTPVVRIELTEQPREPAFTRGHGGFFGEVYWRVGAKGLDAKAILDDFRIESGGTNFRTARSRKSFA
jgi:hypothetical protein